MEEETKSGKREMEPRDRHELSKVTQKVEDRSRERTVLLTAAVQDPSPCP